MSASVDAARQVAREVEQSMNRASIIDCEVKALVAATWLTFAELVARAEAAS